MAQRRLWAFWLVWAAVALLAAALSLLAAQRPYLPGDLFIAHRLQSLDNPDLTGPFKAIDRLGDWPALGLLYGLGILALGCGGRLSEAALLTISAPFRLTSAAVKELVQRPRPSAELVEVLDKASGYSFPSGHALGAMLLFGLLFYIASVAVPWPLARRAIKATSGLLILMTGLARVELGAHWPSDVLGGYLIGGLFLAAFIWLHRIYATKRHQAPFLLARNEDG